MLFNSKWVFKRNLCRNFFFFIIFCINFNLLLLTCSLSLHKWIMQQLVSYIFFSSLIYFMFIFIKWYEIRYNTYFIKEKRTNVNKTTGGTSCEQPYTYGHFRINLTSKFFNLYEMLVFSFMLILIFIFLTFWLTSYWGKEDYYVLLCRVNIT